MSDRLREVSERLETVAQLEIVMTAMRGIAAVRLREVYSQLSGIRAYSTTLASAIGQVIAFLPEDAGGPTASQADDAELIVALSAEQGFAGNFCERIVDEIEQYTHSINRAEILLVGRRGYGLAQARGISVIHMIPMATRVDSIPALAVTIADQIYARIHKGDFRRVSLLHPEYSSSGKFIISLRSLIPFDYTRFRIPVHTVPPMLTLDPVDLSSRLAQEYVYAELVDALLRSCAAENEARVRAMVRARSNVVNTQKTLRMTYQQLRQEQITAEIAELSVGILSGSR